MFVGIFDVCYFLRVVLNNLIKKVVYIFLMQRVRVSSFISEKKDVAELRCTYTQ
jgi:hypothetical protein